MLKTLSKEDKALSYHIRLMSEEDTPHVTEIDHEAFPTLWPPANFKRELQNSFAHYIVACNGEETVKESNMTSHQHGSVFRLSWLWQLFNRDYSRSNELSPSSKQFIVGFAGFWMMADEAHITNIAVRELYRRQGTGELLLISTLDLATELKARIMTLEVRASNATAQNLYQKYGFNHVGVRTGYYIDDKEDAIIMTTENISSAAFQAHLNQLKQAHTSKWGK